MNRVYHVSLGASAPYHCQQPTVRRPPIGMRLRSKLKKRAVKQRRESPIAVTITMIVEAEEWARRALAAQGFGNVS